MSKHTPGPWHLETAHNSVKSLTGEDLNQTVHSVKGPIAYLDESETTGPRYERDANARLIAAAPDLLSALQAACDIIDLEAAIYSARAKVEHETANTRSAGDIEQKLNAKIAQLSVAIGSLAFPRKRRNELSDDLKAKVNYFRAAIAKATGGDHE